MRFLNADEIARGLSPLEPEASVMQAGRLLLTEVRRLVEQKESFALESTLSGRTYINLLRQAKQAGYEIEIHYVWIPGAATAISRIRQRVKQGGHHVPAPDVRRRFERSKQHFVEDYAPIADLWALWNNSKPPAIMVAISEQHSIVDLRTLLQIDV